MHFINLNLLTNSFKNSLSCGHNNFEFKSNIIQIRGWVFLKETSNNKGDSIFISLTNKTKTIVVPIKIDKRPDITSAFKKEFLDRINRIFRIILARKRASPKAIKNLYPVKSLPRKC